MMTFWIRLRTFCGEATPIYETGGHTCGAWSITRSWTSFQALCDANLSSSFLLMFRLPLFAAAILPLLASCGPPRAHQPPGTIGGLDVRDLDVRADQDKYVAVARAYVSAAQRGDASKLMALTSSLTIKNTGREHLAKVHRDEVILGFAGTSVRWGGSETGSDETGNRILILAGEVSGKQSFRFRISVGKEEGEYRVVNIVPGG